MEASRPAAPRGELKKQLYRLAVGRSDVEKAHAASELLRREVRALGDDLYHPLLHAIAISYGRPFAVTRAGNTIGARWERFDNLVFQDTHSKLIELRHKFVAHSDPMERTVEVVPPRVALYAGGREHFVRPGIGVRDIAYPIEWFELVSATAADLGGRLHAEVERLLDELYGTRVLPGAAFPLTFDDDL
jgi:hypothetical protein